MFDYLSRFTAWRPYEHRVLASVDGMLVPMPINLDTVNTLYGLNLTPTSWTPGSPPAPRPHRTIRTSEDVVVSKVGRELYEKFFRGYTRKQWGLDPSELDKSVTARVPTRTNRDDRYFTDTFQAMPLDGYTRDVRAHAGPPEHQGDAQHGLRAIVQNQVPHRRLIFTGPIDEFFDHRYGKLPYRSLHFEHETAGPGMVPAGGHASTIPQTEAYTRITEYKHLTGQEHPRTSITYEYPEAEGDPYYPVPRPENQALYKRYEALARPDAQHLVRRPPRDLPLLQHGPGGRPGAGDVPAHRRVAAHGSAAPDGRRQRRRVRGRWAGLGWRRRWRHRIKQGA